MRLYSDSSRAFLEDALHNRIAEKLKSEFLDHYRFNPSPSEVASWRNSLRAFSQIVQAADLTDHGITLEYQLPLTSKRLDCMVCGRDGEGKDQAVIVELKQWEKCGPAIGENEVESFVGGAPREIPHPSVQVGQYAGYLTDAHTAFYEGPNPIALAACAYLHNYTPVSEDPLFDPKFDRTLGLYPLFTGGDVDSLRGYLTKRLDGGEGMEVLRRVEESEYRPSKKLLDHVAAMIQGEPTYHLLDEQLVVFDRIVAEARGGLESGAKRVIIVKGGPGTGKSVIAIIIT